MNRDPRPGPTQPGTPKPDPQPHPGDSGWPAPRHQPDWALNLRVWATSLDVRVRHGRRAGRLSFAFPVVLAAAFAALWIGGAA